MIQHNIFSNGNEEWPKDGKFHKINGPAMIYPDGREDWWKNNKFIE